MSAPGPDDSSNDQLDAGEPAQQGQPKGYGPAGGYAWIDPWTGLPTARFQPPAGQEGYQTAYSRRPSLLAGAALICGILQFLGRLIIFGNILLAIPAVICGVIALRRIRASGESGRGMAITGLVLGILGILYFALLIAAFRHVLLAAPPAHEQPVRPDCIESCVHG